MRILSSEAANHPYIAKLSGKFQTPDMCVFVYTPILCGDLWTLLHSPFDEAFIAAPRECRLKNGSDDKQLSLPLAKFYIASVRHSFNILSPTHSYTQAFYRLFTIVNNIDFLLLHILCSNTSLPLSPSLPPSLSLSLPPSHSLTSPHSLSSPFFHYRSS